MPTIDVVPVRDLEDAQRAFQRVQAEVEAVSIDKLSPQNVDLLSAASIAIGVAPTILSYRERMTKLPEFEIRNVDNLQDYAKATWYLHVTNLPAAAAADGLEQEVAPLRSKLLMWAAPLAQSGLFNQAAVDRIREGAGLRDAAGDLVALVALYRSVWDQVQTMCGVTEGDLDRASKIGPAVFAAVSLKENESAPSPPEAALRVRKAFTLLDSAYGQCRRAVAYFRWAEGDADALVPSLRRNLGTRRSLPHEAQATPTPTPGSEVTGTASAVPAPSPTGTRAVASVPALGSSGETIGGGASPFVAGR